MKSSLMAYHYSDKMKTLLLMANNLLEAYENYDKKEDIIHAMFDSLDGEMRTLFVALRDKTHEKEADSAYHNLHKAIKEFNTVNMKKSKEYIAKAVSNVTTIAEKSFKDLENGNFRTK
jgi:hypothetical protein